MKYLRMLLAASRISAATLAAMILLVTPAAGQNLLTNPGFTVDPGGWDSFGSGVLLWSTEDADGSDSSGSASLGVFSGGEGFGVSQCVAAVGGSWHRFAASINISTDPRVLGTAAVAVNWYDGPNCTGIHLSTVQTPAATTHGSWENVHSAAVADVDAVSALFYIYVLKNQAGTDVYGAFVDNAFFSPAIFVDGFESGDMTLWSSSFP